MTATNLITGTVAGFVLVIDPENEKGKYGKVEYLDFTLMNACVSELRRKQFTDYNADPQNYDPIETLYYTLYKRDNDNCVEQEEGFDTSGNTQVGTIAHKLTCKCGKTAWFKQLSKRTESSTYVCEDCDAVTCDDGFAFADFTNYDGEQEREY